MELNNIVKDIMGEVGNISMSTAATTLSTNLNHEVRITTPRVSVTTMKEISEGSVAPKVITNIQFKGGLEGNNLLIMELEDTRAIAHLMLGQDVEKTQDEFSEIELSAVAESMNQMIGSASTSLSQMLNRNIDILPPKIKVWSKEEELKIDSEDEDEEVIKISFDLNVKDYVDSEIIQVFNINMVNEIVDSMLEDTKIDIQGEEDMVEEKKDKLREEDDKKTKEKEVKVEVQRPTFPDLEGGKEKVTVPRNLDLIMDVPLEFNVVLGKSKKTIKEVLSFSNGSIVELDRLADEPLEIYVNGKLIAHGEVVVINENFGVRITNILTKEERVKNLR